MAVTIKPEQAFAYAEILEILDYMEEEYVNKIPQKLIKVIKENASDTYERHLDANVPLEEQEISEKTTAILAMLMLNYWCESPEQKQELTDMFNENERKYQEELQRKYEINIILSNHNFSIFLSTFRHPPKLVLCQFHKYELKYRQHLHS